MRSILLIPLLLLLVPQVAPGAVIISWDSVSVTDNGTTATITGMTSEDAVVPFTVTVTTTNGLHDVDTAGPLGTLNPPLNIELISGTRNVNTQAVIEVSIPGFEIVNPQFTLLDIDASPGSGPPFPDWQDEVVIQNGTAGLTITPNDPSVVSVSGSTILGIDGNIPNSSTDGNVLVELTGILDSIIYVYSPGPNDQFGSNQRHGLFNISIESIQSINPVPEPSSIALLAVGGLGGIFLYRRRRAKKPPSDR